MGSEVRLKVSFARLSDAQRRSRLRRSFSHLHRLRFVDHARRRLRRTHRRGKTKAALDLHCSPTRHSLFDLRSSSGRAGLVGPALVSIRNLRSNAESRPLGDRALGQTRLRTQAQSWFTARQEPVNRRPLLAVWNACFVLAAFRRTATRLAGEHQSRWFRFLRQTHSWFIRSDGRGRILPRKHQGRAEVRPARRTTHWQNR